jgi:glycosyltransferase involved in cell wall biosynthesis
VSTSTPEVSVFIQTYQHVDYIRDAVDGVLAQQAPFDFELVIADDCSTDGTRKILERYQTQHKRIRLLLPERNIGPTALFRRSVPELHGRFVAWLDGDDYWSDDRKLALQAEALREHPEWSACFHDAIVEEPQSTAPARSYVGDLSAASLSFADLLRSNRVPSLSFMGRGELVRNLPDWVWDGLWSDWSALLAISRHGDVGYLPRPMGVYRVHRRGISAGLSRVEQLEEDLRFFTLLLGVLEPEQLPLVESYMRERHCQLVVERLPLPFTGAVATLGPDEETPTYLNGRQVWPLATANGDTAALDRLDRGGGLAGRLEHQRQIATATAAALPHFSERGSAPADAGAGADGGALYLLAVGSLVGWLDRYSRLGRQLQGSSKVVWQDEVCAIYEVLSAADAPAPMGALVEIADIALHSGAEELFGCHIDSPIAGRVADAHAVEFSGWAVGAQSPVVAIELATADEAFRRIPVGVVRPDLESAFPERSDVGAAGFAAIVSLVGTEPELTVEVRAVLKDQRRVPFASILARRRWQRGEDVTESPLVSVVVPCFGQARYLEEAIGSVLAQTYAQVQVVVVDDGSPDNSARVAARFPGVRCVRRPNGGLAAARNTGIRESDGELLVFLDADDRLMPRALERGVEELRRHPEAAFTFGRYRAVDAGGKPVRGDEQPRPEEPPYSVFLRYNYAGVPATGMFRRSALEQVGNFDEGCEGAEDYELGLRLSRQFPVHPHDEQTAEYRLHGGGMSRQTRKMLAATLGVLRNQRKYVRGNSQLRQAYRQGRRFWRRYYGEALVSQVRANLANREWREGAAGICSLLRHHPRGLAGLLRPRRSRR